jgi:hypothetical protein
MPGRCSRDLGQMGVPPVAELVLSRPTKKHSFHNWRGEGAQGGAVNLRSGAEPQGAEASTARFWLYAPRRAAQAGLNVKGIWTGRLDP